MKILEEIATVISIISICVVAYGTIVAACAFVKAEILRFRGKFNIQRLRLLRADLGTYLLLGLELLIAADILKTVIEPSIHELGILAGVVLLRTILSFFLNKEIIEIDHERHQHPEAFSNI